MRGLDKIPIHLNPQCLLSVGFFNLAPSVTFAFKIEKHISASSAASVLCTYYKYQPDIMSIYSTSWLQA